MDKDKAFLYRQLIKLGDMMGDGLHYEPGGKWISKEYKQIARVLGLNPKKRKGFPKKNNLKIINENMVDRIKTTSCSICEGDLHQTRLGSMRAKCADCGAIFQLLKRKVSKPLDTTKYLC